MSAISGPAARADPNTFVVVPAAVDRYFDGQTGVVGIFDFDYDVIIDFETKLSWMRLLLCPPAWLSCFCCAPCFLKPNVEWSARAQHVALTEDGIKYVKERRKSLCGLYCTDLGKESKTVPYDKITDCDVKEPAGTACCCCIDNVLSAVIVDTASSGGNAKGICKHELELNGLVYANEFKEAVWSMKRRQLPPTGSVLTRVGGIVRTSAQGVDAPEQESMTQSLLMDIREDLRQMKKLMQASAKYGATA
eukprot:TRINITY_DN3799_c0_g1_i1.p1 TRINITY_DN3799_c0_g1~~TRINITY_DN3799_c0_g1_i1.p1  ORF type:complete len:249 (-),score=39.28 TRINITY_DN3799_c0_g1_i1:127-873(-)